MSRVTAVVLVASAALLASAGPLSAQTTCTPRTGGGYNCYDSNGNSVPRLGGGQNTHDDPGNSPTPVPHSYSQIGNSTPTVPKTGGGNDAYDRPTRPPRIGGGTTSHDGRGNIITCVSRPGGGINCY
jgi:hypothetical protein